MDTGGAETFLMKLYRRLDTSEYQMDFCVNVERECFYDKEIAERGGRIYHIPPKSQSVPEFRKQLTDIIKDNNYKYVLRVTSNAAGFMDLKIAKKAGAQICAARSSNSSDGGGLRVNIAHKLGKILYGKYVDVKFAPSKLAGDYTFGAGACDGGKVSILPNAIDLSLFKYSEKDRADVRKEFGISDNTVVMGHIGRFSKQKNHKFLIEVFSEFNGKNPDSVLLLVGKGELENEIKAQIKSLGLEKSVIFAGIRSDIPRVLCAMDVFVFPSFYEGMPNTVIEAQATGLPCVIADTITQEAGVTDCVHFTGLNDTTEKWLDEIDKCLTPSERTGRAEIMKARGYDIDSAAEKFVKLVFGE